MSFTFFPYKLPSVDRILFLILPTLIVGKSMPHKSSKTRNFGNERPSGLKKYSVKSSANDSSE